MKTTLEALSTRSLPSLRKSLALVLLLVAVLAVAGIATGTGNPGDVLADTTAAAARTDAGDCLKYENARCKEWCWILEPGLPPVPTGNFSCVNNSTGQILN